MLTCAVTREREHEATSALSFSSGYKIKTVAVDQETLQRAIFIAYHGDEERLARAHSQLVGKSPAKERLPSVISERPRLHPQSGDSAKFLATLIEYAIANRASDIHLAPTLEGGHVKLRIDGELRSHETPLYAIDRHREMIARLRVLAQLPIQQRNLPCDGIFEVALPAGRTHIRLAIMPTIYGDKAVLRLHGAGDVPSLSELGLPLQTSNMLERIMTRCEGMILFAGPTGSGKSSTMYALIEELHKRNLSIATIEDPVERNLKGISQTSISEERGLTFSAGLRAILRQDPDVILVGEIRDPETASAAYQAALTGHLVISTVHARDVFEVFMRLKHLGVDNLTIAQATSAIVCQRLIPRLCSCCKVFDLNSSRQYGFSTQRAVGCARCDYCGHNGRVLACESIAITGTLSKRILNGGWDIETIRDSVTNDPNLDRYYVRLSDELKRYLADGVISPVEFQALTCDAADIADLNG